MRDTPEPPEWGAGLDSIQQSLASKNTTIVASQAQRAFETERAARKHTEARLAALFGMSVRRLLVSIGLVLVGVGLSGAADILATLRAH